MAALAVVAGCSSSAEGAPPSADSAQETFFGYEDMVEEYRSTLASLDLPDGTEVPDLPLAEETETFQQGFGEVHAVMAWNCIWGREWLEQRGQDDAAATHALEMYAQIVETDAFARHFDPEGAQPVVRGIIEKAQLGDPSGVQQDVEANCPAS